jgi:prepilin-type N-terminal cleavage/methylation domain-containing protein
MKAYAQLKESICCNDKQGFTLIEVIFALLVFSIGIMAVTTMTISGFDGFETARTITNEVNRSVKTIDTFKSALYSNDQIFNTNAGTPSSYPFGTDNADFTCWDFTNIVVRDVRFIAVENQQIRAPSASGNYRLFYAKPGKQQVN